MRSARHRLLSSMHLKNSMQTLDGSLPALAPDNPGDDTGTEIIAYLLNHK